MPVDNTSNKRFRLRVGYKKLNKLAFLSHLEVVRALERIVRRAGLPFMVSNGYSPHMKISFGTALSVGIESECEMFDVLLYEHVPADVALQSLQDCAPHDLMPFSAEYIGTKEPAVSNSFSVTEYEVFVNDVVEKLSIPEKISVKKKKKDRELRVNVYLDGKIEVCDFSDGKSKLIFKLKTLESGSIKAGVFAEEILKFSGVTPGRIAKIKKINIY